MNPWTIYKVSLLFDQLYSLSMCVQKVLPTHHHTKMLLTFSNWNYHTHDHHPFNIEYNNFELDSQYLKNLADKVECSWFNANYRHEELMIGWRCHFLKKWFHSYLLGFINWLFSLEWWWRWWSSYSVRDLNSSPINRLIAYCHL